MSITAAKILTRVKQITGRSDLTVLGTSNLYIYQALLELSELTRQLKASTAGTLTAEDTYIAKPADMVGSCIDGLNIDDVIYDPLTWDEYLQDKQSGYCVYGSYIYIRPTADGGEAYTLYYARKANDSTDMTTIPFGDEYQPAIEYYCAAKIYEDYELYERQKEMLVLYEREVRKQLSKIPPVVCRPRINTGVRG